ncbi:MAG TPA: MlaD family protein [Candidatus Deferrimicrobiaceae bacterium]|nr:MlaD family protein [Candidatus Deferrimicrobiaceae bacterium]
MTENADFTNVPKATHVPKKRSRVPVVWIVPIVAALVGVGIVVQKYLSEGPTIRIAFRTAEGIEPGKTFIKYKDVEIGKVTEVALSEDFSKILVTAKMEKHAKGLLVEGSRFWIVKPRVTLSGISGIGTLLSGNYIGIEPGKAGKSRHDFVGIEVPPPITGVPGREFTLQAETLGSLGIGSPIYYRRLHVGQVTGYDLTADGKAMDIKIFLNAPYDGYVTPDTRFWEASGIQASVGASGLSLQTESVLSMLIGGIAFETPPSEPAGKPAPEKSVFTLFDNREAAMAPQEAEVQRYVLYFSESLKGLQAGAPVTLLGLRIGEVTNVGLEYVPDKTYLRTRVDIMTYQYRVLRHLGKADVAALKAMSREERHKNIRHLVEEKGLRAQLRTSSLISGLQLVALEYFPDAPKARIDWKKEPPQLPTVPGDLANLEIQLKNMLAKLDKVPVEEIGKDLKKTIETLDRTLTRVEGETLPEAKKTLEDLRGALTSAERVLSSTDNTLLGPDAPAQQELREALKEIARAARGIRVLADYLEQNPEALIRGKSKENP